MVSLNNICENTGEACRCIVANANYAKVVSTLDKLLREERFKDLCRCPRCACDVIALALNYLPLHYYVDADRGGDIGSPSVMVESAVIEAMETVGKNPRHQKS